MKALRALEAMIVNGWTHSESSDAPHLLSSAALHDSSVVLNVNLERLQIAVVDAQHDLAAVHVQLQHPLQLCTSNHISQPNQKVPPAQNSVFGSSLDPLLDPSLDPSDSPCRAVSQDPPQESAPCRYNSS
jgi:hypothetical protein